jgi:lysophospholipase L1-like esterase
VAISRSRQLSALLAALGTLLIAAPAASAWLDVAALTTTPGWIGLYVWGTDPFSTVDLYENGGGSATFLRTVTLPSATVNGVNVSGTNFPKVVRWRCDRLTRAFTAIGHLTSGATDTASYTINTPSCAQRLDLIAPREVAVDAKVQIRILDTFDLGGVAPRVCLQPPGTAPRCQIVRLTGPQASFTFTAPFGHSLVTLTTPQQRAQAVVSAGVPPPPGTSPLPVVVATGDSEMQGVDAQLSDQLIDRAQIQSDVKVGSALSTNFPTNWSTLPARQVRRFHPTATVVFLGANEFYSMATPTGVTVTCCGPAWIAEYTRRIRKATETYLSNGGRAVVWINIPYALDPRRNKSIAAVDTAIPDALSGLKDAAMVDLAQVLTPGGVYHGSLTINGHSVPVRESDGIHLTPAGASIAASAVVRDLQLLHVV